MEMYIVIKPDSLYYLNRERIYFDFTVNYSNISHLRQKFCKTQSFDINLRPVGCF